MQYILQICISVIVDTYSAENDMCQYYCTAVPSRL